MPVTLSAKTLADAAARVAKFTHSSSLAPVLSCTLLEVNQGAVTLSATDTTYAARVRVPCDSAERWRVCVDAKKLAQALKALSGEVTLATGTGELILKSGRARLALKVTDADEYPELPSITAAPQELHAPTLARALEAVLPASSQDSTRPNIATVYLDSHNGHLVTVATDGHRLHSAVTALSWDAPALIGSEGARHFVNALKGAGTCTLAREGSSLLLRAGDTEVHARLSAERFPPWQSVVPKDTPVATLTLHAQELADALKRAKLAASEDLPAVSLSVEHGELVLRATGERAQTEERVPTETQGDLPLTGLALEYAQEALVALGAEQVTLTSRGTRSAVVFAPVDTPEGAPQVSCVVMPRRI